MVARVERESLLLRGTLDMCLLALLARRPTHAYGLVQLLNEHGFAQTSYGTVYPLVSRLRRQGLLSQVLEPSTTGPARNVLTISPEGRKMLNDWVAQWRGLTDRVDALLEDDT